MRKGCSDGDSRGNTRSGAGDIADAARSTAAASVQNPRRLGGYNPRMLTRRAFLHSTAAAGRGGHVRVSRGCRPRTYDLLIKGGRVIDPSRRLDGVRDVGIAGGRIAAVEANIAASEAASTIDATGKLVVPGLIDIHTHARSKEMPSICLSNGVTSLRRRRVAGRRSHRRVIVAAAKGAPNRVRILLNIARTGILPDGELMDISRVDVDGGAEGHRARIAISSSASRRGCRARSPARTISRRCGARRRSPVR